MTIRPNLRCAIILFAAAIWVLPASGSCNPPKSVSSYNFDTGAYSYWHTSLSSPSLTLNASIWSGTGDHTGNCNETSTILYFGAAPGDFGINLSLGDACVVGCPSGPLSIIASATDGTRTQTLVAQTPEVTGAVNFDFSQTGARALAEFPRPQVTSVSRNDSQVQLTFTIAGISVYDGAGSGITGFNILTSTGITEPGRSASEYAFNAFIPSPGGTQTSGTFIGNCPVNQNVWLVTQITTSAGASSVVSQAVRVHCLSLAEPTRKNDKRMGTQTEN